MEESATNAAPLSRRRVPAHRLWHHLVLYALLLTAVSAIIPLDASFGGDDGAYAGQVYALEQGSWALERPLPVVDVDNEGWLNTTIVPDGPLPYTTNPGYVLLLRRVATWLSIGEGERLALGLQLVPLLGALGSAATAWLVTRRVAPTSTGRHPAALAFWLVALGPVLVNSTTFWAHTLSTALAGASLWSLLGIAGSAKSPGDRSSQWHRTGPLLVVLGASLLLATLIRTEAVFWTVAIAVTATLAVRRPAARFSCLATTAAAIVVWVANRRWGASLRADGLPINTSVVDPENSAGWLMTRAPAAWRLLFTSLSGGIGPLLTLVGVAIAAYATVVIHRRDPASTTFANALLAAAAICYVAHLILAPGEAISGTIGAWPIVPILLVAGTTRIPPPTDGAGLGVVLTPAALLIGAVLATQYSISGGHQWGGRYLSMAFVPLAVGAAVRGWPLLADRTHRLALIALLVSPAALGATVSYQLHTKHERIVDTTMAIPAEVVVTEVVALPRIAWPQLPTAYYVADADSLEPLLGQLAAAGVETVNVHGLDEVEVDGVDGYRLTEESDTIRHLQLDPTG